MKKRYIIYLAVEKNSKIVQNGRDQQAWFCEKQTGILEKMEVSVDNKEKNNCGDCEKYLT
ncbi:MAG: hypothetical protein J5986_09180 [Roseburia sp.]|nr:hypothetical protein [Roseburia sp.]